VGLINFLESGEPLINNYASFYDVLKVGCSAFKCRL